MDAELAIDGPGAPPRVNGSLVFDEPWEARAFALAIALSQSGAFAWETFRAELIRSISSWEAAHPTLDGYRYYERWLDALEHVVTANTQVTAIDAQNRAQEFAARPDGHDHSH